MSRHVDVPTELFVPESEKEGITDRGMERTPGLVVEVPPSSTSIDRVKKPRRYADFGVPEYWVADPRRNLILRFDPSSGFGDPTEHAERLLWQPPPVVTPLVLEVPPTFR